MEVLYILGNGFDKAQGLATSYKEFYSYYIKQQPESALEKRIMDSINADYETWADLEIGLGNYSASFSSAQEFRDVIILLNQRLKAYLSLQNEIMLSRLDKFSQNKMISCLCHPERDLEPTGRRVYNSYIRRLSSPVNIRCVSFNYTNTIESILGNHVPGIINEGFYFSEILHIHGTLDDMILVGVNDESQIKNEVFRQDPDIVEEFVKPSINEGCMNTRNQDFESIILNANIIVLFGVSLGVTDNKWWQLIGKSIDSSKIPPLLIYFPFNPENNTNLHPNYKLRWTKQYISFLKERMQIKMHLDDLKQFVCVGINKEFMKLVES